MSLEIRSQRRKPASNEVDYLIKSYTEGEELPPPTGFLDMLRRKGDFHEQRCLKAYKAFYPNSVLEVPDPIEGDTWESWIERIDEMDPFDGRYDVIFQMPFKCKGMRGIADFLIKTETKDTNGHESYTYEPVDSKLARSHASKSHILQLLFYAEALKDRKPDLALPEKVHVALGKAIPQGQKPSLETFERSKYWWHWIRKRKELKRISELSDDDLKDRSSPEKCSFCSMCDSYRETCQLEWGKDSLNDLAGSLKTHREALISFGIQTIAELALLTGDSIGHGVRGISDSVHDEFMKIKPMLEQKCGKTAEEINQLWNSHDGENGLETEQLAKLWRQAQLQSIRKENATCPDCDALTVLSEDADECPIGHKLNEPIRDGNGEIIQFPPRHIQAVAPVFFFTSDEIQTKMKERFGKMDNMTRLAQPKKIDESILGLPSQTPNDVYLDFEGHPFWSIEEELIFLYGYISKEEKDWVYTGIWSHDDAGMPSKEMESEKAAELVQTLHSMWKDNRDMRVYHYNHTERTLLKDLAGDAGLASDAPSVFKERIGDIGTAAKLDELIREGVFIDLLAVVRNSLQVGYSSMSLKYMEKLAGFERKRFEEEEIEGLGGAISAGAGAVFHYELYANHELYSQEGSVEDFNDQREIRKRLIAAYNEDDVIATRVLHEWLLEQRSLHPELPDVPISIDTSGLMPDEREDPAFLVQQRINEYLSGDGFGN